MQASTQVNFGVGCRVLNYDQYRNFRSNGEFTYPAHCRTEACRSSALLCKTGRPNTTAVWGPPSWGMTVQSKPEATTASLSEPQPCCKCVKRQSNALQRTVVSSRDMFIRRLILAALCMNDFCLCCAAAPKLLHMRHFWRCERKQRKNPRNRLGSSLSSVAMQNDPGGRASRR